MHSQRARALLCSRHAVSLRGVAEGQELLGMPFREESQTPNSQLGSGTEVIMQNTFTKSRGTGFECRFRTGTREGVLAGCSGCGLWSRMRLPPHTTPT